MLSYAKLFDMMHEKGIKKTHLRRDGFNPKVVDSLVKNAHVNTSTIIDLCEYFKCQPGDIMEYIPEGAEAVHIEAKHTTATTQKAVKLLEALPEQDQKFALEFIKKMKHTTTD